jgi:HEAT repeat protein
MDLDVPGVHERDVIDGLSAAVAAIAVAQPAAFLDVFADPGFDTNSYVMTGLGYVNDPRATGRLAKATRSGDEWLRMEAAIGLGRHSSAIAVQTLIELLSDREYLVRYHALRGLASIGDASAMAPLRSFRGASTVEEDLAKQALESIARRGGEEPRPSVPPA